MRNGGVCALTVVLEAAWEDERMTQLRVRARERPLSVWRIGIAGGLTAILCCVGPAVVTTWLGTLA